MPATQGVMVRAPAVAGAWYPGSEPALRRTVEEYMDQAAPVELPGRVIALISSARRLRLFRSDGGACFRAGAGRRLPARRAARPAAPADLGQPDGTGHGSD